MRAPWKTDIVRNFALSLWGLLTLVLVFIVLLLANEMMKNGQDPLESLRPAPESVAPRQQQARPATALGMKEVQLFFADAQASYLAPQTAAIEFTDSTVENCRNALKALILGPKQGGQRVLSPNVQVRALYILESDEAVVDFSREFLTEQALQKSASLESLMVQGVVATLTQGPLQTKGDPAVRRVRFLVEGASPPDTFPAHIDLNDAIEPDALWLAPETTGQAQ